MNLRSEYCSHKIFRKQQSDLMKGAVTNIQLLRENCISAMSFSHKADYCAIATKKDHVLRIFKVGTLANINSWILLQDLKDHTQTISDIDWAADNKLLSSSHDRSVYVWRQIAQDKWERMLVNIDIKLSILVSKWAPSGRKFALGSSCSTLALGYYNTLENCWTSLSRDHSSKDPIANSPITTICFHPSSSVIAVGSADFQVKIVTFSLKKATKSYIVESKVEDESYKGPFDKVDSLFEVLFTIENIGGWVNYLSFENNGTNLLILPHNNHIKVIDIADTQQIAVAEEDIRWNGLPFMSGFIDRNKNLILGGFDKKVAKFVKHGKYSFQRYLEQNQKSGTASKTSLVANLTRGLQKRESLFGKGPSESEHVNAIKVMNVQGMPVSYDVNGIVHFWSES